MGISYSPCGSKLREEEAVFASLVCFHANFVQLFGFPASSNEQGDWNVLLKVKRLAKLQQRQKQRSNGCAHVATPGTRGRRQRQNANSVKPVGTGRRSLTLTASATQTMKSECFRHTLLVSNTLFWKENSRGHSCLIARGANLGFVEDELLRKHLPRMFSLIKNENWEIEDDQLPS